MKAVIDHIEGEWAVLHLQDGQRINVLWEKLPSDAQVGDYLELSMADGAVKDVEIDRQSTQEAKVRIQEKLERLRRQDHLDQ